MPAAPPDPLDDLARGLALTEALLPGAAGRWSDPTPCEGWTVLALVEHLVAGHRLFADAASGTAGPFAPAGVLGHDAVAAHRDAGAALQAAFAVPGAQERPVTVPVGTLPGAVALRLRIVESLVHGWDLARATGRTVDVPDDLAERTLAFTHDFLPNVPAGRTPFGAPHPVTADAPPLDRLVALLGRDPH